MSGRPVDAPLLVAGERLAFEDGSEWIVERVGSCSATVRCVAAGAGAREVERPVVFGAGGPAERRTTFREWRAPAGTHTPGERLEVSPRAQVRRVAS